MKRLYLEIADFSADMRHADPPYKRVMITVSNNYTVRQTSVKRSLPFSAANLVRVESVNKPWKAGSNQGFRVLSGCEIS